MDHQPIVIRLSAALALKEAGIIQPALFSYYTIRRHKVKANRNKTLGHFCTGLHGS